MDFNNTRLATAQWADSELVAHKYRFNAGKFWLGCADDAVPLGYHDDRHICLVSGNRGGKGTSVIINNLCLWPGSVVVIDPKGENATVTAARRGFGSAHCKGMGQAVYVLDPFKVAQVPDALRTCFNPLDALDPDNPETIDEAGRIADALVVVNRDSKDPFWDESARSLVKGLILHVLTDESFAGRRNLVTVRDLITRGDWQMVETLKAMGETDIASGQALLWEGVRRNMAFNGILAGIGESFGNMATSSPKQFESVLQVANRNTEFMDSEGMRHCLSSSGFALSDLKTKREGVSLYLSLPQRYMNTHYRWLRMMISLTVTEMEKVQGRPATGHRVLMCLDEFAGLKHMEIIENAVAQIAGYGVTLFFVLQSLEQLKATYKENWETFLSNSGLKIFFSLEDHFSREYVSKLLGETEITVESQSQTSGVSQGETRNDGDGVSYERFLFVFRKNKRYTDSGKVKNYSNNTTQNQGIRRAPQKRALITPDELGKFFGRITDKQNALYPGFGLVLISGENPFPMRRVNYFEDRLFAGKFDPHPDYIAEHARTRAMTPEHQIAQMPQGAVIVPIEGLVESSFETLQKFQKGLCIQWLVKRGQQVRKNDRLAGITDAAGKIQKGVFICAPESGIIKELFLYDGTELEPPVAREQILGYIETTGQQIASHRNTPYHQQAYKTIPELVTRRKTVMLASAIAGGILATLLFAIGMIFIARGQDERQWEQIQAIQARAIAASNEAIKAVGGIPNGTPPPERPPSYVWRPAIEILGGVVLLVDVIGLIVLAVKLYALRPPHPVAVLERDGAAHIDYYERQSKNFYPESQPANLLQDARG